MALEVTVEFGIRVDGQDAGMTFETLSDAEGSADCLFARGFTTVEIFRREEELGIPHPETSEEA